MTGGGRNFKNWTPTIDLMIFWQTSSGQHIGQENLLSIPLSPSYDSIPQFSFSAMTLPASMDIPSLSLPFRFTMHYAPIYHHDFSLSRFCVVPVEFRVRNLSRDSDISFLFEALRFTHSNSEVEPFGSAKSNFFWSGLSGHECRSLAKNTEQNFTLNVCFLKPGVYNINRFHFMVTYQGIQEEIYSPSQHIITIELANTTPPTHSSNMSPDSESESVTSETSSSSLGAVEDKTNSNSSLMMEEISEPESAPEDPSTYTSNDPSLDSSPIYNDSVSSTGDASSLSDPPTYQESEVSRGDGAEGIQANQTQSNFDSSFDQASSSAMAGESGMMMETGEERDQSGGNSSSLISGDGDPSLDVESF